MVQTRSATKRLGTQQQAGITNNGAPAMTVATSATAIPHPSGLARRGRPLARSRRRGPYNAPGSRAHSSKSDGGSGSSKTASANSSASSHNSLFDDGSLSNQSSSDGVGSSEGIPGTPPAQPAPTAPRAPLKLVTPPRPLARARQERWTQTGTSRRFIAVDDTVRATAQVQARQKQEEEDKQTKIFQREYYNLVVEKEAREQALRKEFGMARIDEDEAMDTNEAGPSRASGSGVASSSTSGGRRDYWADRPRGRPLGPNGTELILDHSLVGVGSGEFSQAQYPQHWVDEPSNALRRRSTDLI